MADETNKNNDLANTTLVGHVLQKLRKQPKAIVCSYGLAALGILLAINDFRHPAETFSYSTPFLGGAILLYLFGIRSSR